MAMGSIRYGNTIPERWDGMDASTMEWLLLCEWKERWPLGEFVRIHKGITSLPRWNRNERDVINVFTPWKSGLL
jgi:hypothetical protein